MATLETGNPSHPTPAHVAIKIQIDRTEYTVNKVDITGAELRNLPNPPIGHERDLFKVGAASSDTKIEDSKAVKLHNGMRFFTAPAHINPGKSGGGP